MKSDYLKTQPLPYDLSGLFADRKGIRVEVFFLFATNSLCVDGQWLEKIEFGPVNGR